MAGVVCVYLDDSIIYNKPHGGAKSHYPSGPGVTQGKHKLFPDNIGQMRISSTKTNGITLDL